MHSSFSASLPLQTIQSPVMRGIANLCKNHGKLDEKLLVQITRISRAISGFMLAVSITGVILGSIYFAPFSLNPHIYLALTASITLTLIALKILWDHRQLKNFYDNIEQQEQDILRTVIDREYVDITENTEAIEESTANTKLLWAFKEVLQETGSIKPSNNPDRCKKFFPDENWDDQAFSELSEQLGNQRDLVNKILKIQVNRSRLVGHYIYACYAQKNKLGNCGELSDYSFFRFFDLFDFQINIEKFKVVNGDHAFLVLNRDFESDPTDYRTWKNAWIFDPWACTYFPAREMEVKFKCRFITCGIKFKRNFNRRLDAIFPLMSNIYSLGEFENQIPQKRAFSPLKRLLAKLHKEKNDENKIKLVDNILNECSKLLSSKGIEQPDTKPIYNLSAQCTYYLKLKREGHRFLTHGLTGFFDLIALPS